MDESNKPLFAAITPSSRVAHSFEMAFVEVRNTTGSRGGSGSLGSIKDACVTTAGRSAGGEMHRELKRLHIGRIMGVRR